MQCKQPTPKGKAPVISVEVLDTELVRGEHTTAASQQRLAEPPEPASSQSDTPPRKTSEPAWLDDKDEQDDGANPLLNDAEKAEKMQQEKMAHFLTGVAVGAIVVAGAYFAVKLWRTILSETPLEEVATEMKNP
jgi:hypothetical protein